jgi:hypothetical protein
MIRSAPDDQAALTERDETFTTAGLITAGT